LLQVSGHAAASLVVEMSKPAIFDQTKTSWTTRFCPSFAINGSSFALHEGQKRLPSRDGS